MLRIQKAALAGILVVATFFSVPKPAWSQTVIGTSSTLNGVPNWAHVDDNLYRGAQPSDAGFKELQKMGVTIVVDFRDEPGEISGEKREVEALGMKYVSIPWSGSSYPSSSQVVQFLDLVRANPQAKIFVHCKRGADRTGVMVAAYRIAFEHKDVADAVLEMHQFHYDHFWLPQLESYVKSLPQLLSGDPLFAAYTPISANSTGAKSVTQQLSTAAGISSQVGSGTRIQ